MPQRVIHSIVIHCSASANGVSLGRVGTPGRTSAEVIDDWHRARKFARSTEAREYWNPQLTSIGYHFVIDVDGARLGGRHVDELGAHVAGHNRNTLGICLIGTDKFTRRQWQALRELVNELLALYPNVRICGHRELSPDRNGDGRITRNEWTKICPGFDVTDWWLSKGMEPIPGHIQGD